MCDVVTGMIPEAKLLTDVGTEITFQVRPNYSYEDPI